MAKGPGVSTTFHFIAFFDQHSYYIEKMQPLQPFLTSNALVAHLCIILTFTNECKGCKDIFVGKVLLEFSFCPFRSRVLFNLVFSVKCNVNIVVPGYHSLYTLRDP